MRAEVSRLRAELEQARVAAEDAAGEAVREAGESRRLETELLRREQSRREALQALTQMREQLGTTAASLFALEAEQTRGINAEEELTVTLEEMQVLVEELDSANQALRHANAELERRVTERTMALSIANAELQEVEERLSLAQRVAEAGTWDWNIAAGTHVWSDEFRDLYGKLPGETIPSREAWLAALLPDDRVPANAALQECLTTGRPEFAMEFRVGHPRKGVRWLAARGRFMFDAAAHPLRMIGLHIDITERRRAVEALDVLNRELAARVDAEVSAREAVQRSMHENQKLEALGQLTGGVAHDFNNLLTVVISGLHLLSRDNHDAARRRELVARILGATERGAELTRRLLAFGRRQELHPVAIDLPERMSELGQLLAHSLREDIGVETNCPGDLWPARVDPGVLELALINIAVNARDAMPQGGTLCISAMNRLLSDAEAAYLGIDGGAYVELRASDTGTGMPEEVRAHAFEPFFTTKEVGKGTGLGLAQVYGFARQSGGTAIIESALGGGTSVILLLPRAGAGVPPEQRVSGEAPPLLHAIRLLVVEDNVAVADGLADLLTTAGHTVVRAADFGEAAEILASQEPLDMVLTDVLLPAGHSGADVVHEVRRRRPGLPVVLTTGYGGPAMADPELAALPMLRKPYDPETLAATLGRAAAAAEHAG